MRNVRLLAAATCLVLIGTVALTLAATSGPRINATQGMTLSGAPLAIHGYDPVAYFTEGRAMLGSAKHTAKHQNAAFRFVSAASKKTTKTSALPRRPLMRRQVIVFVVTSRLFMSHPNFCIRQ